MAGQHHQCNGHELRQTSENGEGQGGLACCSPWGHRESDTTGQLNNNKYYCVNWEKQFFYLMRNTGRRWNSRVRITEGKVKLLLIICFVQSVVLDAAIDTKAK